MRHAPGPSRRSAKVSATRDDGFASQPTAPRPEAARLGAAKTNVRRVTCPVRLPRYPPSWSTSRPAKAGGEVAYVEQPASSPVAAFQDTLCGVPGAESQVPVPGRGSRRSRPHAVLRVLPRRDQPRPSVQVQGAGEPARHAVTIFAAGSWQPGIGRTTDYASAADARPPAASVVCRVVTGRPFDRGPTPAVAVGESGRVVWIHGPPPGWRARTAGSAGTAQPTRGRICQGSACEPSIPRESGQINRERRPPGAGIAVAWRRR
jgi:hypothetical protein